MFTAPLEVGRTETEWTMFTGRGLSFPVIIINILSGDHMWLYVQDKGGGGVQYEEEGEEGWLVTNHKLYLYVQIVYKTQLERAI